MRTDETNLVVSFIINKSRESASVAHNVLWFCKVESALEKDAGRKVPLPVQETLPWLCNKLYKVLLSKGQMSDI